MKKTLCTLALFALAALVAAPAAAQMLRSGGGFGGRRGGGLLPNMRPGMGGGMGGNRGGMGGMGAMGGNRNMGAMGGGGAGAVGAGAAGMGAEEQKSTEEFLADLPRGTNGVPRLAFDQAPIELLLYAYADEAKKVWTLKLRNDLHWSDGEKITADDVVYTVGLIVDSSAKTTIAVNFTNVKVEKKDELTTVFTLPSPYTDFEDTLEFPLVPAHILGEISPALVYESNFSTHPVGSGPFVLNAMQSATATSTNMQTVYLNRNEKYYKSVAKLDSFTLKTYENSEQILEAMRNSDVMATAELTKGEASELPGSISRKNTLINGGAFAFLNTTGSKLSNVKVRQAIQRGVNMEKVRKDIDDSQILDYPILQRQEDLKMPDLGEYNLEEAKKLIVDAGLKYKDDQIVDNNGKQVMLNISVPQRDVLTKVAERFGKQLERLGFGVVLNAYDEAKASTDFFSAVVRMRDYDILIYEVDLGVSADPFVYYSSLQASGSGWNFSNYSNGLADDALISARTTTNAKLRKTKFESFLKRWTQDVPSIGLYQSTMTYCHMPNVQIYSENSELTDVLDRFSDVQNWASRRINVNMTP